MKKMLQCFPKVWFLYIDPLKQGLKHASLISAQLHLEPFLYIDPLKQGLKR